MEKFVMNVVLALVLVAVATETMTVANAQNCGPDGGGKTCPDGICCSQYGWCGTTPQHCQKSGDTTPPPETSYEAIEYVDVDMNATLSDRSKEILPRADAPSISGSRATRVHQTIIDQPRTNDRNSSFSTSNSTHTDEDDSSYNDPHCGTQGKGLSCPDGFCCSRFGYCGTSALYCGEGCQDSCSGSTPAPY
ncbi:Wound-induced protein WIN1 [Linum perenne]